jgi:hypothetical protein
MSRRRWQISVQPVRPLPKSSHDRRQKRAIGMAPTTRPRIRTGFGVCEGSTKNYFDGRIVPMTYGNSACQCDRQPRRHPTRGLRARVVLIQTRKSNRVVVSTLSARTSRHENLLIDHAFDRDLLHYQLSQRCCLSGCCVSQNDT